MKPSASVFVFNTDEQEDSTRKTDVSHPDLYVGVIPQKYAMEINNRAKRLRIYVSNTDKYKREPLYEYLARTARELGIAGATIYKGVMGYGTSSDYIAPSFWDFAEKVPVTLEIIDNEDPIRDYLATIKPLLDELPKGCLITAEDVDIIFLKHGEK